MLKGRTKLMYPKDKDIQPEEEKDEKRGRKKKNKRNKANLNR